MSPNPKRITDLEQITQQSFNQKTPLFQRIRNSLASKLAILISAGTFALANCGDENKNPVSNPDDWPQITQVYQGGIPIKSGKTNQNGQIFFTDEQTGEPVTVNVKDESESTVPNAPVTFFDGDGFETYQVNHPNFAPYLHVFSHNSSQELALTSAFMQFHIYSGSNKENSKEAAKEFTNYVKTNSQLKGCEIADEITIDAQKRINALGEISGKVPGGETGEYVAAFGAWAINGITYLEDKFREWGITENQCAAYQTWANEDVAEWNLGPDLALRVYGCMTSIPAENCSDGIDNDCDHKIDSEDNDCNIPSCSDECSPFGYKVCTSNAWKECGDFDSDICLDWSSLHSCGPDEYCEDGECTIGSSGWTCNPNYYGADDGCDCGCSIPDPDCNGSGCSTPGCSASGCDYCFDSSGSSISCLESCIDECSPSGQRDCFGDGWKECGDYDIDDCLEWGILNLCGADEYCENGLCQSNAGNGSYCDPCNSNSDCQEGMICMGWTDTNINWCTDESQCDDNSDCGGGYFCHPNNICTPFVYLECHDGDVWYKDNCSNWIFAYETCNDDETCQDGQCVMDCIPSTEICNGSDDDCDGQIDENLNQACYTACGQGLEWCINGTWQNCNAPQPLTEVCDNSDNDCDGDIDEGNLCNGADCLEGICCYPYDHVICESNHESVFLGHELYWVDSCGRVSDEMAEDCQINTCSCSRNGITGELIECHCGTPSTCYDPDMDGYGPNCNLGSDCDNSNSNIHPGAAEVLNGLDDNCNGSIDEGFVNTGNPQITLFWNNAADLDLHVYSPDGCHLYYGNTNCGTGHLDRDANRACQSEAEAPPENIYWDSGQAPTGTYEVEVKYFRECSSSGPTPYTVSISRNGNVTTYDGTLNNENDTVTITNFSN